MALGRRIASLFRRSRLDRDISTELEAHIEMRIEDNVARGVTPEEARRDALLRFGNPVVTKERVAGADVPLAIGGLVRNVHYALRQLRRSPGFAITAILALALGIGPNVAIFSIIFATFLAPMPYPNANQLVVVWNHFKGERVPTPGENYAAFAAESQSFQSLSFQSWISLHLTNPDHTADETGGLPVTPGLQTRTVQEPMFLGRDFRPDEGAPGNDHVVIFSYWLWQHRYDSDRNIVGKSILVEDQPYTVVGVVAASPNERGDGIEFNVPVRLTPGVNSHQIGIMIGRLKPGVTLAQAQAELSVIDKTLAARDGRGANAQQFSLTVEKFRNDWLAVKAQRNLWLLLAAVSLVLLIACANLANLLLARGTSRRQELAVRSALGATRGQIFAQLLTESVTLAVLGGAIGIAMGWGLMKLSLALFPNLALESSDTVVGMNLPVLCFAAGVALIAGVLAGCAPGWRGARVNQSEALKKGSRSIGRTRSPLQAALVIAEVALALILLSGAGMAMHSFWNLSRIDLGFRPDHTLTADLQPRNHDQRGGRTQFPSPDQIIVEQHQLLDRVRAMPGVLDAALATSTPMHGFNRFPFEVAGQPVDKSHMSTAGFVAVTPSYFKTLGIQVVRGRFITEDDDLHSPRVVMVNETFVRRYLGGGDPLTQRLMVQLPGIIRDGGKPPAPAACQIVGVFHDVREDEHLTGEVQPEMYVSQWQLGFPYLAIAVRTVVDDPAILTNALQRAVASVNAGTAIDHVESMNEIVGMQTSDDRFEMLLFAGFAAVALLLASVGIYGVMSFAVAQRTHEIGVRMALGARRSEVVRLILRGGMAMALPGIGLGLAGAFGLGWLMRSTLYGVQMVDAGSLIAVAALLFAVAVLACWIPARRSAAIDPMRALRAE
jgi:putative ABC transport system permease protein